MPQNQGELDATLLVEDKKENLINQDAQGRHGVLRHARAPARDLYAGRHDEPALARIFYNVHANRPPPAGAAAARRARAQSKKGATGNATSG